MSPWPFADQRLAAPIAMSRTPPLASIVLVSAFVFPACSSDASAPTTPDPPDPPPPVAPNVVPVARFTVSVEAGTAPLAVTFDGGSSTDSDGTVVSYAWAFGDGSTGTGAEVTHTFDAVGLFRVELSVQDDRGGEDSTRDSVFVSSPPGQGANVIRGTVWFDGDLSGTQDVGEPGLERFVVFLDADGNGTRDVGEALTFTDTDGSYAFDGLEGTQSYVVTQALPFGWSNTTPGPAPVGGRSTVATAGKLKGARIIGGEVSEIEPFPFQVALMIGDFQFCGGTLLNSEYVLSAAHCTDGLFPVDVEVLIGTNNLASGGERVGVEAFRSHPEFDNSLDNDVALLRLDRPILYPRVFVQTPDQLSLSEPGKQATVVGWGQLDDGSAPDLLRRVDGLPIITNEACANSAGAFFGGIGPRTICAGADRLGKGPCFGDSGGPLLVPFGESWAQVGIVSFGVNVDQCGNIPAAFSRVTELYEYIVSVARIELSGTHVVDWAAGPVVQADFANFH